MAGPALQTTLLCTSECLVSFTSAPATYCTKNQAARPHDFQHAQVPLKRTSQIGGTTAGLGMKHTIPRADQSCNVTLQSHIAMSHCKVSLQCHTAMSHCNVTLQSHTAMPHCKVTLQSRHMLATALIST